MSFTANPLAEGNPPTDPPQESTGPVASDSLAAESVQADGAFAENDNADVMGVKGASSTLANTDTSAATVLHPSEDGATREKEDAMGLGSDEKGTTGVKYPEGAGKPEFGGAHSAQGYVGGPSENMGGSGTATDQIPGAGTDSLVNPPSTTDQTDPIISTGVSNSQAPTTSTSEDTSTSTGAETGSAEPSAGVRPYVDQAPNVFADIRTEGQLKPKGDNLTEGDVPETKTFTGDVGGQHDPGRVAEQQMLAKDAAPAGEGVGGIRQSKDEMTGSTGAFDVLSAERADKQGGIDE